MAGHHDTYAKAAGFSKLRQTHAGLDAVNVQDVGPRISQPSKQMLRSPHRHAMVSLVARRAVGDRVSEDRDAVVLVLPGRRPPRVGRGDQHVVSCLFQPSAQPFDVHFSATDAVGKIPAEQVDDLHVGAATCTQRAFEMASASDKVTGAAPRRPAGFRRMDSAGAVANTTPSRPVPVRNGDRRRPRNGSGRS